jgi:hypothetical protein
MEKGPEKEQNHSGILYEGYSHPGTINSSFCFNIIESGDENRSCSSLGSSFTRSTCSTVDENYDAFMVQV